MSLFIDKKHWNQQIKLNQSQSRINRELIQAVKMLNKKVKYLEAVVRKIGT